MYSWGWKMGETLADALPKRMKEIREVFIPAYQAIGPTGSFAIAMMQFELSEAERALASQDVARMMSAYQALMDFKL